MRLIWISQKGLIGVKGDLKELMVIKGEVGMDMWKSKDQNLLHR